MTTQLETYTALNLKKWRTLWAEQQAQRTERWVQKVDPWTTEKATVSGP